MCRTYGRMLAIGALFALVLPGLMAVFLMAPTSEVPTAGLIDNNQLSVSSHVMTSREVEEMNSSVGIRQDGKNYNVLIDGHGTGLAPPTTQELASMVGTATVTDKVVSTGLGASATYDISTQPYFPIIGNQGSSGSCAAWAMTYYAYGYEEAKDNGWTDASTGNPAHLMSPAWTFNMVDGGIGQGTFMDTNAAVITSWGVATMATDPYLASDQSSWGSQAAFLEAPLHRALSYSSLTYSSANTISSIKVLISANVPVTFAIDANQYSNGLSTDNIMSASEYTTGSMNHAQCIVGYDDSMTSPGHPDVGAFKVANSWGTSFGSKGYYWISYDTIKKIGASGLLYPTYITDKPAYQPTLIATWQFSSAPTRNSAITVGIGAVGSATKLTPYFVSDASSSSAKFPTYMALDVTGLASTYAAGTNNFYLTVGTDKISGVVSSFKTAQYLNGYNNAATTVSGQSPNVPASTPCSVTVTMTASSGTASVPGAPTGLAASQTPGKVALTWSAPASSGSSAIKSYTVYRGTSASSQTALASVTTTSYTDAVASAGTYYYTVRAVNAAGSSAASNSVAVTVTGTTTTTVPGTPSGVSAVGSNGAVMVSWLAPSNGGSAITGYRVYRSTVSGSETLLVILGTGTSYTNTGLSNGMTYYYRVSAVNAKGESAQSVEVHAVPSMTSTVPGPFTVTAKAAAGNVALTWTVPSSSSPITAFCVMRKDTGAETTVARLTASRTGYTDMTAVAGKDYTYRVVAYNAAGSTSTPTIVVHAVGMVGDKNTLDLGISCQASAAGLGALLVVVMGTICSVAVVMSRRK